MGEDRSRKRGIHLIKAHKNLAQIREDDPKLYSSVMGNSAIKVVLGLNNPDDIEEAERYMFIPGECAPAILQRKQRTSGNGNLSSCSAMSLAQRSMVEQAKWTQADLKRLGLTK